MIIGRRPTLLLLTGIFFAIVAPARSQTLTGVQWPIPFDETNASPARVAKYRALLSGREIRPLSNGVYSVLGVRIESYQFDGATNLIAKTPDCFFNADSRVAWSSNRLFLESPNGLSMEGIGFRCQLTNVYLVMSNEVRTSVQQQLMQGTRQVPGGVAVTNLPGTTNIALTVEADRVELDYTANLITYLGHVRLEHSQMRLESEILRARRGTNGALERVEAEQEVRILNKIDNSRASGDLAIYSTSPSEILQLSGHAHWQDDQRRSRAELFLFEPKTRHLRAEGNAWMSLPRQMIGQPDLWDARPGTNQTRLIAAMPTNSPVEISAEVLDLQMASTNQPARFMVAERNVTIVSAADKSRATADRAVFDERTGLMELRGEAQWQAGDRMARADVLQYDRTNKVFTAHTNAYLRVATADLGSRAMPGMPAHKTASLVLPDFIEVFAKDYTYNTNLLVFRGDVRGNFLDGKAVRGTIACGFLGLQFSNQLQTVLAMEKVVLEQLPFVTSSGKVARKMQCEQLHIKMSPSGTVERVVALTNVLSHQEQWRTNASVPVRSHFGTDFVTAEFFPRTNQVKEAVARGNVWVLQEQPRAAGDAIVITNYLVQGDRAVFTGTNNIAELTGHPTAYTPRGSITNAEVLIWDRTKNIFMGRQVQGRGEVQGTSTNAPRPPELPLPKTKRKPR